MFGAIIGDIVGSRFEWRNYRAKDFDFFHLDDDFTDDSVMTVAICKAILDSAADFSDLSEKAVAAMREVGNPYPDCGYGARFREWMYSENPQPYDSFGNGAAMRVSACGYAANSIEEAKALSEKVTAVTHNHAEGIKGAETVAVAIYMARSGKKLNEIRDYINANYYPMNFTIDSIRDSYVFNETCQDTVPQALMAFFESNSFEDAVRIAVSVGGDSDTLAAITGSIAEAYYGIDAEMREDAASFLDESLLDIVEAFESKYPAIILNNE